MVCIINRFGLKMCQNKRWIFAYFLHLYLQDVTCDQCIDFLTRIADLLQTPEFADAVAADLTGAVYCEDTTYIPAEQADACKGFMDVAAVPAVNALGSLMKSSAERICTEGGCTK